MNINEYQKLLEHKSHTNDNFPYNTYLCTIPLDFSCVPVHWHDEMELIVIKKGEGRVQVDLVDYMVYAGDVIVVLPGKLHAIEEMSGHSMEYENILFRMDFLFSSRDDLCFCDFFQPMIQGKLPIDCYLHASLPYYDEINRTITSIDSICTDRPLGYQLAVKGYLFQFFFILTTNHEKKTPQNAEPKNLEKLKLIIRYIDAHYGEPITIASMAQLCYYSESHFMKFFKQQMKVSFIQYLNNYRLTMAARLLTTTSYSVLEIAAMVGLDNLSYFNRLFKKRYGVTPTQMR
jgi:AraC-like DNA-binding protein